MHLSKSCSRKNTSSTLGNGLQEGLSWMMAKGLAAYSEVAFR